MGNLTLIKSLSMMKKAQVEESSPDSVTLKVCGRLAEGWVDELDRRLHDARVGHILRADLGQICAT